MTDLIDNLIPIMLASISLIVAICDSIYTHLIIKKQPSIKNRNKSGRINPKVVSYKVKNVINDTKDIKSIEIDVSDIQRRRSMDALCEIIKSKQSEYDTIEIENLVKALSRASDDKSRQSDEGKSIDFLYGVCHRKDPRNKGES